MCLVFCLKSLLMIRSSSLSSIPSSNCQSINPWFCFIFSPCLLSNILTITPSSFCFLSTEWLMQHIHKHPQGMLAEMWKKNVAVHFWTLQSQRFICNSTVNRAHPLFPLVIQRAVWCNYVFNSTFSLLVGGKKVSEIERLEVGELEW